MTWPTNLGKCQPQPKGTSMSHYSTKCQTAALRKEIADFICEEIGTESWPQLSKENWSVVVAALRAAPSREPAREALADELVLRWKHTGLSSKLGRHTAISKDELNLIVSALRSVPDGAAGGPDEDQIKHMVNRFLCWRLPKDFNPDCGISFNRKYQDHNSPSGTNLFDAAQADAMVRYMVEGMPAALPPATPPSDGPIGLDWGQVVQCLLRVMDTPEKGEGSRRQAERMADALLQKSNRVVVSPADERANVIEECAKVADELAMHEGNVFDSAADNLALSETGRYRVQDRAIARQSAAEAIARQIRALSPTNSPAADELRRAREALLASEGLSLLPTTEE